MPTPERTLRGHREDAGVGVSSLEFKRRIYVPSPHSVGAPERTERTERTCFPPCPLRCPLKERSAKILSSRFAWFRPGRQSIAAKAHGIGNPKSRITALFLSSLRAYVSKPV